jgi:hypothetical protein
VYILDLLTLAANPGNDSLPSAQPVCLPLYLLLRISHDMRSKLLGSVSTHFLRLPLNMSWVYAIMGPAPRADNHRLGSVVHLLRSAVLHINDILEWLNLELSLDFVGSDVGE